jgi:long-chain acyl-CoA synthetase
LLLQRLQARGTHQAVIAAGDGGIVATASATLANDAIALAGALRASGIGPGMRVALSGPNGADWITVALGVMAAGAALVPVDDLCDGPQFAAALTTSRALLVIATAARLQAAAGAIAASGARPLALDAAAGEPAGWRSLQAGAASPLPVLPPGHPLVLSWTSGTTGSAKIFPLSVGNIAANVGAIEALAIVGPADRALLPLPLHHAYPLVVGVLSMLTVGTAIVLPAGPTGPQILQALRGGQATALIGVPRLYDAIVAALQARVNARGALANLAWRAALAAGQRLPSLRFLFAPVRRGLAPRLRLLVSGGARLDPLTEERLGTLGWTLLCGYGLAETASMFTGNLPGASRPGSAGRPLGDGTVRIAGPDAQGTGEVQLRGSTVTAGYLDNPEANAAAFTADGWFRTGDLGRIDADGFLFVTGRAKEILVLGGGKKIDPEVLERSYAAMPGIAEIGLLEAGGALVALVRPDTAALHARGILNQRDGVHVALAERAQSLPSHERLSGFALTEAPLPRTQLGKLRRFLLASLYAEALAGVASRAARPLTAADAALLREPTAAGIWALLRTRFPAQAIDPDVNLALDLNLDSFGWMELSATLAERFGVVLAAEDIAAIATIRDLLRAASAHRDGKPAGSSSIALDFQRWLAPPGLLLGGAGMLLFGLNLVFLRTAFRLRVRGAGGLPARAGFVITPNHASDLDPLAIAAALPFGRLRQIYWGGDIVRLFASAPSRLFCRAVHLYPVDERHPAAAIAAASQVLAAGGIQVWFPEGWRSPDGTCQRFLPGIGQLLLRSGVPAVPAWIAGSFDALPRSRRVPRLRPIRVTFGAPVSAATLLAEGEGRTDAERVADGLRRRVMRLAG